MAVYGHASMELRETDCRQWPCSHVITDTCRYHWSSKPVVLLRRGCNSVLRASVLISPHIFGGDGDTRLESPALSTGADYATVAHRATAELLPSLSHGLSASMSAPLALMTCGGRQGAGDN